MPERAGAIAVWAVEIMVAMSEVSCRFETSRGMGLARAYMPKETATTAEEKMLEKRIMAGMKVD